MPAIIAPPTVSMEPVESGDDHLRVRARYVPVEQASWNRWTHGVRLFNQRAGYLFELDVEGSEPLTLNYADTTLERNVEGAALTAEQDLEVFLLPLQSAALHASSLLLDVDFADRARAAGEFRSAWLTADSSQRRLQGLVGFRAEDTERHVTAMRLTLAVQTPAGPRQIALTWD